MENNNEYYEAMKERAYTEAGLVFSGKNEDGENEWIGTQKRWDLATELLDKYLEL
jgi:hypothetical protein